MTAVLDKTLMQALEQLATGDQPPPNLVRRLAREDLCTNGAPPELTTFGADVLQLRRALADPPDLTAPKPVNLAAHVVDVTPGELELLRLAAVVPLSHPDAEHLPCPVQPRTEDGDTVLDLTDRQLAAVQYVFRLHRITTSVRFSNRLASRIQWWDMHQRDGEVDPLDVRGYRRLQPER
jgi:hypothetical protein